MRSTFSFYLFWENTSCLSLNKVIALLGMSHRMSHRRYMDDFAVYVRGPISQKPAPCRSAVLSYWECDCEEKEKGKGGEKKTHTEEKWQRELKDGVKQRA